MGEVGDRFVLNRVGLYGWDKLSILGFSLDRESIASQCMDIHRNPRISKWVSIKAWITEY